LKNDSPFSVFFSCEVRQIAAEKIFNIYKKKKTEEKEMCEFLVAIQLFFGILTINFFNYTFRQLFLSFFDKTN